MTREERKAIYSDLCIKGKITSLFMQPWWLDAAGDWDVSLAVRNGQVIGAMPYAKKKKWMLSGVGLPPLTQYLSIWMDKPPDISSHKWLTREKQIIWLLLEDLPSYAFFSMVFEEKNFDNWLPFYWKGFRQEMRYTFVIDKSHYYSEDYQVSRNVRRHVKDSADELRIVHDIDIYAFYKVCQETYKRQNIPIPYSLDLLMNLNKVVSTHHAGVRLGAYNKSGDLLAVSWLVWDKERAYYLVAGDNEAGRESSASLILTHESIRIAFEEKKVSVFDFCGSMLEPISEIRRQFGARSVGLMKISKAKWRWLDIVWQLRK